MRKINREELLSKFKDPIKVLDHGYIQLVDVMGGDTDIIASARVSYSGEKTTKVSDDRTLIRYLMRMAHSTPIESCEIKLQVKLPIFVERQWARLRTASWNEMSGRYSVLPNEFYIPEESSVRAQSKSNKQGREEELPEDIIEHYRDSLDLISKDNYERYEEFVENSVARELARCILPINIYTAKVWKINLHNLLHFLKLRMDSHAQWEIRQYANAIAEIVKEWVPYTWEAFEDYRLNSISFSAPEIEVLNKLLAVPDLSYLDELLRLSKLSKREVNEFKEKLVKING